MSRHDDGMGHGLVGFVVFGVALCLSLLGLVAWWAWSSAPQPAEVIIIGGGGGEGVGNKPMDPAPEEKQK